MQVVSSQPSAELSQPKWPGPTPFLLSLSWRLRIAGSSKAEKRAAVACASVIDPAFSSYGLQTKIGATEHTLVPAKPATASAPTANALVEIFLRNDAGSTVDQVCGMIFTATYFASESPLATAPPIPSLAADRLE